MRAAAGNLSTSAVMSGSHVGPPTANEREPILIVDGLDFSGLEPHELAVKDACCCGVRWTTFFGLQFQMDSVGRVIVLS